MPSKPPITATSEDAPLSALWRPTVLIAVVLAGEALALILALAPGQPPGGRLVLFGLASLGIQWVLVTSLCALYLLRHVLARLTPPRLAWVCLGLLLATSFLVAHAAWRLLQQTGGTGEQSTNFVLRMLALALVVGLIGLLTYQNYWQSRQLAVRAKQLQLEALRARIRPHFLFNTLNTGAALVHARPFDAERLLLDLADLFRAALRGPELVPLAEEIELTRRYLEIEELRLGERLQVRWQLPDAMPEVTVPVLSLQPLAENAVRHGIEPVPGGGGIDIRITQEPGWLRIEVENDMPGDGSSGQGGHRIGLDSARQRIRALGDGHADVETRQTEDGRHLATTRLPLP
ncbi:MAG: histidine kinase [Thermomonas sp.]|uniref:sensor histidine kinase n=1 Tax=Thermomonas sp. TaxID=1971895 RepID=UPI0039E391DD